MSELNARGEHAVWLLDALIDIYDDGQNNAPEDRCCVEGAWAAHLADIRAFLSGPSNVPDCNGSHDYGAIAAGEQACTACCPDEAQPRFPMTYCSQCGSSLGPGNEGVSSCKDHK